MKRLDKIRRWLPFTIALLGVVTFSLALWIRPAGGQQSAKGFTIISTQTYRPADGGEPILLATSERYQKANGEWKEVTTSYDTDGTVLGVQTTFARLGHGVFRVDEKNQRLVFLSPMSSERPRVTEASLRSNPQFVREESVLGHNAFVSRFLPDDSSADYTELYDVPSLQGLPLKRIFVSSSGTEVFEPTKIMFGEPDKRVFAEIPQFAVSREFFEQKSRLAREGKPAR